MKKLLLISFFFLSLYPKIGKVITMESLSSLYAQISSTELNECEDEFGPYESSFPCDDTPCVTRCSDCGISYPCDENCPDITYCSSCRSYHHSGDCPNDRNNSGHTGGFGGSGGTPSAPTRISVDNTKEGEEFLRKYHDFGDCMAVCRALMKDVYEQDYGSCENAYRIIVGENGQGSEYLEVDMNAYRNAQNCLDELLSKGGAVICGVDHTPGQTTLNEGITDHFIVVTGVGYTDDGRKYYRFLESGSDNYETQQGPQNRLYCDDTTGFIRGDKPTDKKKKYTMTQVRPNDGGSWTGTSRACK